MKTVQEIKDIFKEFFPNDKLVVMARKKEVYQFAIVTKIEATVIIFNYDADDNCVFMTHFIDTICASNFYFLKSWAWFLMALEKGERE